jgi:zinc protease
MSTEWRVQPPAPGAVRPFAFPRVTRLHLDNGLTVLHAHHGTLPVVALRLVIAAGASTEPVEQAGLARLTASTLDAGTDRHDGPGLAWAFERLGVELETDATWDAITLEANVPASRLEPALALMAEVARHAAFAEREVERVRGEQLAQILQRRAEPRALADDSALRFIFADGTRFARPLVGARATVDRLGREDVAGFHDALFAPPNTALVIVGNLDADSAARAAATHLADWDGAGVPAVDVPVRGHSDSSQVHVVHRPGAVQSELRVGHVGVHRAHPDHVPLLVMNALLGGMFTSRLNLNLRERHGFTYGVRTGFGFRRAGGTFVTATAVATEVTTRALEEILGELERMHSAGATEEEVAVARDYLAGVMPLELQTAGEVADALSDLFVHDLPDDWHGRHREALAAVPVEEVARVAQEHLHPDGAAIVVVGDVEKVRQDLGSLGRGSVQTHEPG